MGCRGPLSGAGRLKSRKLFVPSDPVPSQSPAFRACFSSSPLVQGRQPAASSHKSKLKLGCVNLLPKESPLGWADLDGEPGGSDPSVRPAAWREPAQRRPFKCWLCGDLERLTAHATFPTWKTRAGVCAIRWGFNVRKLMQQAYTHLPLGHEHLCPKALQCDCTPMGLL